MSNYLTNLDIIAMTIENDADLMAVISDCMTMTEDPRTSRVGFGYLTAAVIVALNDWNLWDIFPSYASPCEAIVVDALARIVDEWDN